MATFAERLKQLRKEKGITQENLAKTLFITKSSISKYENGVNTPENKLLQDIADFFEVSTDYMLGRSDDRNVQSIFSGTGVLTNALKDIQKDNESSFSSIINEKDRRDIEKQLNRTIEMLELQDGLMLSGEPIEEADWEFLKKAIQTGLEYAKAKNKQKYTPKKI